MLLAKNNSRINTMRRSLIVLILVLVSSQCLGRATPPEQVKLTQQQNEVLGKFARRVGEKELNILLNDPNDPALPGLPVGDLLYILSKVNEDKLIDLVKGIGATTTLELILAIKRVGCTRANNVPAAGAYTFDATVPLNTPINSPTTGLNYCTWKEFHLPNIMVQLLNGANTNGLQTLIDTVNHSYVTLNCASNGSGKLDPNQPLCPSTSGPTLNSGNDGVYDATVSHYAFLMKLAYIVAGFDTPTSGDPNLSSDPLIGPPKLFNLMNLTLDGRDMVFLLNSFDSNVCPALPATNSNCVYVSAANVITTYAANGDVWADIQANNQFQGLQNLLSIMLQVTNTAKMGTLINGYRTARYNTAQDDAQIRYYIDRLKVVLEHSAPAAINCAGPYTNVSVATATQAECDLQNYTLPQGPVHAAWNSPGDNGAWNTKLATVINYISNINRMMDLVYYIDDGYDINHVQFPAASWFPNRGIDNLLVLLNNLNNVANNHVNDLTGYNPPYTNLTANPTNTELASVAYLIDNVAPDPTNWNPAKRNKIKYLVQYLGDTLAVLKLACYTAVADNNPVGAGTCANRGLMNQVADGSKLDDSSNTDLLAAGKKLTQLTGGINDIESMRFLVRNVDMANLTAMIKGMLITGTTKTANLVNQITGNNCWGKYNGANWYNGLTTLMVPSSIPACTIAGTAYPCVGAGYTSPPVVTFTATGVGPGTAAKAVAVIETNPSDPAYKMVKDVIVLTPGSGYDLVGAPLYAGAAPTVNFAGGGGAGASSTAVLGSCSFQLPTSAAFRGFPSTVGTGATGLGKMVNIINHVTGSPKTLVDLINNVNDGQQLGILINGIGRSSNLVGVMNGTIDAARKNNATITDLINLLNNISRVDTYKLVHMIDALGNATETSTLTFPAGDHDMVAQLIAPYCRSDAAGLASATCPATTGNYVHKTSGLGYATMSTLVSSLSMTGGGSYTPTAGGQITVTAPGGLLAIANVATVGAVTGVTVTAPGSGCTSPPTINFVTTGGGSGAVLVPYVSGGQVAKINVISSGSGYTSAPTISVSGGGCVGVTATVSVNGIGSVTVVNGGAGYTNNALTLTIAGVATGSGAVLSSTVSGALNTTPGTGLSSFAGGTGYTTGNVCPVVGAGGTGGTCTVQAAGGVLTGCSAIGAGSNYSVGRIVKIGGGASAYAIVAGNAAANLGTISTGLGAVTGGVKVADATAGTGCGYAVAPIIQVVGCTVAPTAVAIINGSGVVTDINVTGAGSGCGTGVKVIIGESPYVYHSDGGTAIVNQVTGGVVTSISVSDASINAAQLVQLLDRDATGTGIAFSYRNDDYTWPIKSACSSSGVGFAPLITDPPYGSSCPAGDTLRPTISTREGMIRLLHHGITPTTTSPKAYFNASTGAAGPAGGVAGTYSMDWPGIGPQHVAGAILNNVSSSSTQTLITLMNSDTISLEDTIILLGCGDRLTYSNGWTAFGWQALCTEAGPGIW
ncbi:MAG: hypothetical protein U1F27_09500 [Turneriella sp.]